VTFPHPDFRYPSGKTMAEMEAWHERWELDHGDITVENVKRAADTWRPPAPRPCTDHDCEVSWPHAAHRRES